MIRFPNGKSVTFLCAAGALGLDGHDAGNGIVRPWKWLFKLLGQHRPHAWGLITKTLTYTPRKGRLRWWCPWRCVRPLGAGNWCNSVGLTNPGYRAWIERYYARAVTSCDVVIPSLSFDQDAGPFAGSHGIVSAQAQAMLDDFNKLDGLSALEINLSCPNSGHVDFEWMCWLLRQLGPLSRYPFIVKLGPDLSQLVKAISILDSSILAFDVINTVPFTTVYPHQRSPLAGYGLEGGVSGPAIRQRARIALATTAWAVRTAKVISGGGITTVAEIDKRFRLGASAVTIGTAFLRPWLPLQLQRGYVSTTSLSGWLPPTYVL